MFHDLICASGAKPEEVSQAGLSALSSPSVARALLVQRELLAAMT